MQIVSVTVEGRSEYERGRVDGLLHKYSDGHTNDRRATSQLDTLLVPQLTRYVAHSTAAAAADSVAGR